MGRDSSRFLAIGGYHHAHKKGCPAGCFLGIYEKQGQPEVEYRFLLFFEVLPSVTQPIIFSDKTAAFLPE